MSAGGVQWWCSAKGGVWTWTWRPYPGVWLFAAGVAAAYAVRWRRALRPSRARRSSIAGPATGVGPDEGPRSGTYRRLSAAAGVLLLWIALDWPVGPLGAGYLETVHMLQFLLIVMIAPPLLIHGLPPKRGPGRRRGPVRRALTRPVVALVVSATLIVAGHTPTMVDTLMTSQLGSLVLDLDWLAAGLVLWWPLLSPREAERVDPGPLALIYLFVGLLPDKGIGIWLLLARWPQYRTYELAPPVHGISANTDQGVAGGLMLFAGMIVLLVAIGFVVRRWAAEAAPTDTAPRSRPGSRPAVEAGSSGTRWMT